MQSMALRAVAYCRVSTDEQDPVGQLQVVRSYAEQKGYGLERVFEERASGTSDPFERPVFRGMLDYISRNGISVVVMYDLTRFFRAGSPTEALQKLRSLINDYKVFVDFAREPEIEDPLLKELWMFIKSWFSSYERLQISLRTRYGLAKVRGQERLYHKPDIEHYYAAWLYNKDLGEVTRGEVENARKQLVSIVSKYWHGGSVKKTRVGEVLRQRELSGMYTRFPKAPSSYYTFRRLMAR